MQVLYEEDGELKVGTVLSQAPASLQIESPHGRRSKIKTTAVLLNFERPQGGELIVDAQKLAETIEPDFLWHCCGTGEFGFVELAREYVGREPTPVEAAGILVALQAAPMYFYRRGRGRFHAAPEQTLKLALAGVEKKKRLQEQITAWSETLARFECPPFLAALKDELLYAPDRAKPETKAFEQACRETGLSPARLLERCGLLPDAHDYHLKRFLHEFFPNGTQFPPHEAPSAAAELPLAEVAAFSLDDIGTTEIDDAFSVGDAGPGVLRIGIHIAAPALGFAPGSGLDAIARARLSTAYMPGLKYTMLPEDVIEAYSLDSGAAKPAFSLYLEVAEADGSVRGYSTRAERIRITANLRHAQYDSLNEVFEAGTRANLPFEDELRALWRFATALEARRGRPAAGAGAVDYSFYVEEGSVRIVPRRRGAPLDKLVSEMMILANTTWGGLLAERDVAAIYRVQSTGKVRLSVYPEPHEGLGVSSYAWLTSPLRRYVDLVNQWQLAAALSGRRASFGRSSDSLLAALRAFEVTYARYDEHQRAMETYWALRWLLQEDIRSVRAVVLRENLVRLDGLPLVTRVSSMPLLEPNARVRLDVEHVDLFERTLGCVYRGLLESSSSDVGGTAGSP
jgi:exoribonuclease-2